MPDRIQKVWPSGGDCDLDQYIEDLARSGALTPSLNWYRANLAPRMPGAPLALPPVQAPVMGVWSAGDITSTESA